jgi:hypothetical protein
MKKVQSQLAQVKEEMNQTKKLAFEIPMTPPVESPPPPQQLPAARRVDDETRPITHNSRVVVNDNDDDDDDDDIVVNVAKPVAPKTPTAADLRARAKAIDQSKPVPAPVSLTLEQRVAILEQELREERAARALLEKRLAHLLK